MRPSRVTRPQLQGDPVQSRFVAACPCCSGSCHRASRGCPGASSEGTGGGVTASLLRVPDVRLRDCGPVLPSLQGAQEGWTVSESGCLLPSAAPGRPGPSFTLPCVPARWPPGFRSAAAALYGPRLSERRWRVRPPPAALPAGVRTRAQWELGSLGTGAAESQGSGTSRETYSRSTSRLGLSCEPRRLPAARGCFSAALIERGPWLLGEWCVKSMRKPGNLATSFRKPKESDLTFFKHGNEIVFGKRNVPSAQCPSHQALREPPACPVGASGASGGSGAGQSCRGSW